MELWTGRGRWPRLRQHQGTSPQDLFGITLESTEPAERGEKNERY